MRIGQEAAAAKALGRRERDRRKIRNVMVVPLRSLGVYIQETGCRLRDLLSVIRRTRAGYGGGSDARLMASVGVAQATHSNKHRGVEHSRNDPPATATSKVAAARVQSIVGQFRRRRAYGQSASLLDFNQIVIFNTNTTDDTSLVYLRWGILPTSSCALESIESTSIPKPNPQCLSLDRSAGG